MKMGLCLLIGMLLFICPNAQTVTEPGLENQQKEEDIVDDDSWMQELAHYSKHAIDLNKTDADELRLLMLLSDLQIESLLMYRRLLGSFTSIFELQAVPSLDIPIIKKILPYITITGNTNNKDEYSTRVSKGIHSLLLRVSQNLERSTGFLEKDNERSYLGGAQHILFRYKYSYKNLLQWGIVGDKDAGERFLTGAQKKGFDFLFLSRLYKKDRNN